nr:hypothetical protein [Tanacetum cinerariifolium]
MMQSIEGNADLSKALDDGLVVMKSNETESERHILSSRTGNDTHTDDADFNSVNDKQPMAEVQLSAEHNILANEQQHSEQSASVYDTYLLEKDDRNTTPESTDTSHRGGEINQNADVKKFLKNGQHGQILNETSNEANIKREINVLETKNIDLESSVARLLAKNEKLNKENKHLKQTYKDLSDFMKKKSVQTKDHVDSLIVQLNCKSVENADLKAQIQEKVFANVALKNKLRKLKGNSMDTKFAKPSILEKPVLQPPKNQSVARQPNAFKSERPNFSKPRFASQVDVNNVLSKPVTPHYLPKLRESAPAKPHHVNAPSSFRNMKKESYGSNDMAHDYYLEEAKKKTQDKNRNLKPREMPSAKTHQTPNACTPKPRSNNQTSRNWPASKSCEEMLQAVQKADHSRNPSSFLDFKHFVCSTCHKCFFNANHDACITKFLKEVNSHAKIQPNKTRNSNKSVDPTSQTQKPGRKIVTGHSFSPKKSSSMHDKTNTPRSCLRWIPTGRIFNTAGLKWVPTGKTFTFSTTKVDCEPPNGLNDYITNPYKCDQTLNVSAGERKTRKGQNRNKTGQKREAWRSPEMSKPITNIPACCDDDDDYNSVITPILSTEEPDNSLSMGDEHLDTIPATESDEVIKSSVEDLVSIPSEFEEVAEIVTPEKDEIEDDNLREKLLNVHLLMANIEALKDNPTPSFEFLTKSSSTSPKSFLEETNTFENSLPEFENFYFDLEEISSGSTTIHSDISLPDYEAFCFDDDHIEEISSCSTTTHSDISLSEYDSFIFDPSNDQFPPTDRSDFTHEEFADELAHIISPPEYDCFYFRNLPNPGELIYILNIGIRENFSTTRVNLPVEDDHFPLLTYVIWIFLAYLTGRSLCFVLEDAQQRHASGHVFRPGPVWGVTQTQ